MGGEMNMIAITDMEPSSWEKLLSGQVGFILATILFGLFFWKVLLPRWDKQCAMVERLADSIKLIAIKLWQDENANAKDVAEQIEKLNGNDK